MFYECRMIRWSWKVNWHRMEGSGRGLLKVQVDLLSFRLCGRRRGLAVPGFYASVTRAVNKSLHVP
jgi:hypothetical protein